jgi:hypothetical protein
MPNYALDHPTKYYLDYESGFPQLYTQDVTLPNTTEAAMENTALESQNQFLSTP